MLIADSVTVNGRHDQLVPPTSLQVMPGEVHLVVADPQISRTALALALSGRMKPTTGAVSWGHADSLKTLRQHTALLDSPEVNEPESHMKVRDLIVEDLALIPGPIWRKPRPKKWMEQHGFSDVATQWADAIDPVRRLELLLLLAAENPKIQSLVLDSPDRHDMHDEMWLGLLLDFAESHREFAVVAIVANVPYDWDGPVSHLGSSWQEPLEISPPETGLLDTALLIDEAPEQEEPAAEEFVQEELDLDLPEPASEAKDN
ncbi:ABC transporter ATP-binding protein [Glutamicibacter halophytocola]|uniref:ABC transporter ATP-binding protein n=1 Tax=Glutamicibacter halophytocola TaxID=1933880 RepID=A0ABX5YCH6_9MICC|nr:ABC transporter ATP-binding protein [Glutamicibacter halophytocola]QDY67331.1 ABC transporter ATP-binding protein [Glutamicibacter halophytocola]